MQTRTERPSAGVEIGIVEHEGKEFAAYGAVVTADHATAYPGKGGKMLDWSGNEIGTYRILSSRPAVFFGHRSYLSDRQYFIRATIGGRVYSGRGFGVGMVWNGKAVKGQ